MFLWGTFHSNTSLSDLTLHKNAFIIVSVLSLGGAWSGAYLLPSHVIYVAPDHKNMLYLLLLYLAICAFKRIESVPNRECFKHLTPHLSNSGTHYYFMHKLIHCSNFFSVWQHPATILMICDSTGDALHKSMIHIANFQKWIWDFYIHFLHNCPLLN